MYILVEPWRFEEGEKKVGEVDLSCAFYDFSPLYFAELWMGCCAAPLFSPSGVPLCP